VIQTAATQPQESPAFSAFTLLQSAMRIIDRHMHARPAPHGNTRLNDRSVVGLLLCAAFEPAVRTLRALDDLSLHPRVADLVGIDRAPRSTLSDRLSSFDAESLRPVLKHLLAQQPRLKRFDPECEQLTRQIIAADGSWWNLAGEVVSALQMNLGNKGDKQSRVRLNLQLDIDAFLPHDFDVSGAGDGSEAAAFMRHIDPDVIYVVDRGFVHFGFINAVLDVGANLVLRLKTDTKFSVQSTRDLCERDRELRVLRDEIGSLSGPTSVGNKRVGRGRASRTTPPPTRTLRRVVVWDTKNQTELLLLTDLLNVPAYVIASLYRQRWQIELFLRWLKVFANFDHLMSTSPCGITTQFYVAVIATLLTHMASGRTRVSKHALRLVAWVAQGRLPVEKMAEAMARHERERMLERIRIAKKRSA